MKKELFEDLVASIREAGKIHRGETKASRTFVFQPEDVRQIREKLHGSAKSSICLGGPGNGGGTLPGQPAGRRRSGA